MKVAFFGSSLVSAYWNGAATYYRGIIRALNERGFRTTFYEPDAFDRQQHRDIDAPSWARSVVYEATEEGVHRALQDARDADLVVKASGVGVFDALLEEAVLALQGSKTLVAFWDVDAPATLGRVRSDPRDPFRALVSRYDLILTYGGGPPVIAAYRALGARDVVPIYNALDPSTHHPVAPNPDFAGCLGFLGNRLPDREARVEQFFLAAAATLPEQRFLLGGSGWADKSMPSNVHYLGHVYTADHNAFNCTPLAVLNISRDSMASMGFSPATRVFEAAGAGACLITDAWEGIEQFLEPDREVLVATGGAEVAAHLDRLDPASARAIGQRALARVLAEHTYAHRAKDVEDVLGAGRCRPTPLRSEVTNVHNSQRALDIVILGLSITSSWGNGHATTYRGLVRELEARGHQVRFLERDVPWYAAHRDLPQPPYGSTSLYGSLEELRERYAQAVASADLVIVGSYVPDGIEVGRWVTATATGVTAFYDIDTPVTLARLQASDCAYLNRELIGRYHLYLSFSGGPILARIERDWGSPAAKPLYCSVDPTLYFPQEHAVRWDLGYMGTYSDDRQPPLEELLCEPARRWPDGRFIVAGPQYPESIAWPANVERREHLPPAEHRQFYNQQRFTLNITRRDMIEAGYSPSVRLFEAAACGTPIISDAWDGLGSFFELDSEIFVARNSAEALELVRSTSEAERIAMGERARQRVLCEHTAAHRAKTLEDYAAQMLQTLGTRTRSHAS